MRKRFFLNNLVHTLSLSILPILLLSTTFFLLSYRGLRSNANRETLDKLVLVQKIAAMMFNDSTKVLNFLEDQSLVNSIKKTFSKNNMSYSEYLTYQHVVQHLQAVANSSEYIDSIYIYIPNRNGLYLTSNATIQSYFEMPDQNWLTVCRADPSSRFVRRKARLYATLPDSMEYLTVVDRAANGIIVAINIKVSDFKKALGNLKLANDQTLLIINQRNELLLSSGNSGEGRALLKEIGPRLRQKNWTAYNTRDLLVVRSHSDALGLDFLSVTPGPIAYRFLNWFIGLSLLAGAACLLLCIALSSIYASRTTRQVYSIINLLEAATQNKPLPSLGDPRDDDIYGYIISNIVRTFVQNDYLKTLLNERKFHAIALELSALQYQINPHFLSNTLQAIDFEVMRLKGGPSKANRMIGQLSSFLQYSLRSPNRDVTVAEEIEATKVYIELMEGRYANRFEVEWAIDPAVLSLPVPKLILQPMVENSITHSPQLAETPVRLRIGMERAGDTLLVTMSDNGPGVTPERLEAIRESLSHFDGFNEKHIGLQNLFRRLQLRFDMECRITVESVPGAGFAVSLFIPAAVPGDSAAGPPESPEPPDGPQR